MKSEIILIDKPSGMSSFGVVARVRRVLTEEENQCRLAVAHQTGRLYQRVKRVKVGHTGTLDPFATGLLILLTGENTKYANNFLKLDKEYIATLRLGAISTTGDPEGKITELWHESSTSEACVVTPIKEQQDGDIGGKTEQKICKIPNKEVVENCVEKFVGENSQKVPKYSAVKINGERAYKLARAGKTLDMPIRKIMIYELEVLNYEWPQLVLRTKVSSGTYIRALAEDIGEALGTGAYLTALRRTEVGQWQVRDAIPLEKWLQNRVET